MARSAKIEQKQTWVYIEDDAEAEDSELGVRVVDIEAGKEPPGGGSVFALAPVPLDLFLELSFYASGETTKKLSSGRFPSDLLQSIVSTVVVGWRWVPDAAGKEVVFVGPESVELLDVETQTILGFHAISRAKKGKSARGKPKMVSEPTRRVRPSSGIDTGAPVAAENVTS